VTGVQTCALPIYTDRIIIACEKYVNTSTSIL
jgi:hypothetical protein